MPSSLNTCDTFTLAFVVVVAAVVVVMGIVWFSRSGSIMAVIFSLGRNTKYEYSYYCGFLRSSIHIRCASWCKLGLLFDMSLMSNISNWFVSSLWKNTVNSNFLSI